MGTIKVLKKGLVYQAGYDWIHLEIMWPKQFGIHENSGSLEKRSCRTRAPGGWKILIDQLQII